LKVSHDERQGKERLVLSCLKVFAFALALEVSLLAASAHVNQGEG